MYEMQALQVIKLQRLWFCLNIEENFWKKIICLENYFLRAQFF